MQEHQADDGQVARGSKTGPEACHFIDRERDDVEPGSLTRNRLRSKRGRPRPIGLRCR